MTKQLTKRIFTALAGLSLALAVNAAAVDEKGLTCAYGIPGLNESDPEILLGVFRVEVPFKAGTELLSDSGLSVLDFDNHTETQVSIVSHQPTARQLYAFTVAEPAVDSIKVSVSSESFKGKYAGVPEELAKQAVASTAAFVFANGVSEDLPGLCFVVKSPEIPRPVGTFFIRPR
ncbi:MAG: hypothetical protein WCW52_04960 [Elusimicrobiales bacterium]|jgi:hypothetical protein